EEPFNLLRGHLVLMGHSRPQDGTEALIVAVNAAEIASLRDAHADVRHLTSEGVDQHERAEDPRTRQIVGAADVIPREGWRRSCGHSFERGATSRCSALT